MSNVSEEEKNLKKTVTVNRSAEVDLKPFAALKKTNLTVIVPAYNEENSIADTVQSILDQTAQPDEIIVVDDCSTDKTAEIARSLGVKVLQPVKNTGSKAGAQNYALQFIDTKYTLAIDGDTSLARDGIEILMKGLENDNVAAACGFVIPRRVKTIWERGRYIEYMFAFSFYKQIQDYFGKPLISSGCFSVYQTAALNKMGGWSVRTLAEDMDLTWSFYKAGYEVKFVPEALCYPIEPHNFEFMRKQLKRWSHGFVQNVLLHWKEIVEIKFLRSMIAVALWDAVIASIAYLIVLPILAIVLKNPFLLLGYVIDLPAVLIPTIRQAIKRKEVWKVISSIPAFFVLRTVNGIFILEALLNEVILRKSFRTYEKGH